MSKFPILKLKKNEEKRITSGHLWIYSNEVNVEKTPLKNFAPGDIVCIESDNGKKIGIGYINPNNLLCARLLSRDTNQQIDNTFFIEKITQALELRNACFIDPFYRLIFSEGDYLPGLIVDRFDDILVVQTSTFGMENLKSIAIDALVSLLAPKGILLKNNSSIRDLENLPHYAEIVYGNVNEEIKLKENGVNFLVPVLSGQKTGWFYDHRQNRLRICNYVKHKKVLDVFSYVGGFGIQAAVNGHASEVYCIESSDKAINFISKNAEMNSVSNCVHAINGDAFEILQKLSDKKELFDVVILDPPAFIKKRKDIKIGIHAYKKLNSLALRVLKKGGFLLSASCSMHMSRDDLLNVIRQASIENGMQIKVVEQLHQAADHPIHPAICETNYLKGFIAEAR